MLCPRGWGLWPVWSLDAARCTRTAQKGGVNSFSYRVCCTSSAHGRLRAEREDRGVCLFREEFCCLVFGEKMLLSLGSLQVSVSHKISTRRKACELCDKLEIINVPPLSISATRHHRVKLRLRPRPLPLDRGHGRRRPRLEEHAPVPHLLEARERPAHVSHVAHHLRRQRTARAQSGAWAV